MVSEPFPVMAPEPRRWDPLTAMAASLQLSMLCTAAIIAVLFSHSHTVTTMDGIQGSFMPPTVPFTPSPTPQHLQDHSFFSYTARFAPIFSHLYFQELAPAASSCSDSTSLEEDLVLAIFKKAIFSVMKKLSISPSMAFNLRPHAIVNAVNSISTEELYSMDILRIRGYRLVGNAIIACFYSSADANFFAISGISWNLNRVNQACQWVEQAIVFQPQLHSPQSVVCDVLLKVDNEELTVEERNLLSVAYKHGIGARRASWRLKLSDSTSSASMSFLTQRHLISNATELPLEDRYDYIFVDGRTICCPFAANLSQKYHVLVLNVAAGITDSGAYRAATSNVIPFTSNFPHSAFIRGVEVTQPEPFNNRRPSSPSYLYNLDHRSGREAILELRNKGIAPPVPIGSHTFAYAYVYHRAEVTVEYFALDLLMNSDGIGQGVIPLKLEDGTLHRSQAASTILATGDEIANMDAETFYEGSNNASEFLLLCILFLCSAWTVPLFYEGILAAPNVRLGLNVEYRSVIIPTCATAVNIFVSFSFAAMCGIFVAALGMLSTIAMGLATDAYGSISANVGGIAEMAGMSRRIREKTDAFDAATQLLLLDKGLQLVSAAPATTYRAFGASFQICNSSCRSRTIPSFSSRWPVPCSVLEDKDIL